jgi:CDP-paratose 2-epimerase
VKSGILVTGGAGFVGSKLAIQLQLDHSDVQVFAFDNLKRRGSELNLPLLREAGVVFVHGDIRQETDLDQLQACELIIDCCAEPSVMAGLNDGLDYLLNTNLMGTALILKKARQWGASLMLLSSSRIFPIPRLLEIPVLEYQERFDWKDHCGIDTDFSLEGHRSFYGFSKYASELLLQEYFAAFSLPVLINRCGVIAGPGQFGKVDQGFVSLWVAAHTYQMPLQYIGFAGSGKQIRDVLHIDDLYRLIRMQIHAHQSWQGEVFHVGGGHGNTVSLRELTTICQQECGQSTAITANPQPRPMDIPVFYMNNQKVQQRYGWQPQIGISQTVRETHLWLNKARSSLQGVI